METTVLCDLLKLKNGEMLFKKSASTFISLNRDVELFLKEKALQSAKLYTSSTYLVAEDSDLAGYFTLATKMLTLSPENISSTQAKIIKRFVSLDSDTNTFRLPAILLAQFGRNFSKESVSITGIRLMENALEHINKVVSLSSGKIAFLECEPKDCLISFYDKCGFRLLNNVVCSKSNKSLVQMFRVI